jgi:hypothetical protein
MRTHRAAPATPKSHHSCWPVLFGLYVILVLIPICLFVFEVFQEKRVPMTNYVDESPGFDVFLIAGQSNAVGDNWRDEQPLDELSKPSEGADILVYHEGPGWQRAQLGNTHFGVHNYSKRDSVGPDMSFARTLISLGISKSIGLIPTAKCNSCLAVDWAAPRGAYYQYMLRCTRDAMHNIFQLKGTKPRLSGVIWVQGESDAVRGTFDDRGKTKADLYLENLEIFIKTIREDLSEFHKCLPIIMGVLSPKQSSLKLPFIAAIRAQQLQLTMPAVIKVDMDTAEFYEQSGITLHLSKRGQSMFGSEMAKSYMSSLGNLLNCL